MASAKSLEEMLSSVVDERAVNAFVRSLDSQLSTNVQFPHQDITSISNQTIKQSNILTTDGVKHGNIERSTMTTNNSQTFCVNSLTSSSVNDNVMVTLASALPASGYMSQVGPSPPIQPSLVKNITPMEVNPDAKLVYAPLTNVTQLHTTQVSTENRTVIQRNTSRNVSNGNINISGQPNTVVSIPSISKTMNQLNTINTQSPIGSNTILVPHSMLLTADSQSPLNGSIKEIVSETKSQNSLPQTILTSYGKQGTNNSLCNQNLATIIKGSSSQIVKTENIPQSHIGATTVSVANIVQSQQSTKHVMSQVSAPNMLSGVQLINMCAGSAGTITTQKTSAPRVVFSNPVRIAAAPQVIAARPRTPIQNTITLPQGLIRSTLLVRTDNGQLQVVNVAPGITTAGGIAGTPAYRLESVQTGIHPNVSNSILHSNQPIQNVTSILPSTNISSQTVKKPTSASNLSQQLTIQTNTANGQVTSSSQMSPTTAKKKCKNFLSTLLRLANGQAGQVAKNVEKLIQGIIDDTIQPEEFSHQLQKELNSSPQPYLIPFLKKNLPYLRHSMMIGELSIEGIKPPPPGSVILPVSAPVLHMKSPITQMRVVSPALISGNLSTQLTSPAQTIVGQRLVTPKLQGGTSIKTISGSKSLTGLLNQTTKPIISSRSSVAVISKDRERDKKSFTTSLRDDDDINDVAAMGGVNLIEESQRILATTAEIVGTQIRSCKDETFFSAGLLQRRISKIAAKHGVDDVSNDVIALVSHAAQERLKSIIEKLGTIAAHYVENPTLNPRYEITSNVKEQLNFLKEVDRYKMNSSNTEEMDISKVNLINKFEERSRLNEEGKKITEDRKQTESDLRPLASVGTRKRSRTDFQTDQVDKKVKKVTLRDLLFVMELERQLRHSPLLYKSYVK